MSQTLTVNVGYSAPQPDESLALVTEHNYLFCQEGKEMIFVLPSILGVVTTVYYNQVNFVQRFIRDHTWISGCD